MLNSQAKTDADVSAFVSDLTTWTDELKQDEETTAGEPIPLRPRNGGVPIRNVPTTTFNNVPVKKKKKKGDDDDDEGRGPSTLVHHFLSSTCAGLGSCL